MPIFSKEKPLGATKGKSRRGGLHPRRLPITKKKVQVLAEEEEEVLALGLGRFQGGRLVGVTSRADSLLDDALATVLYTHLRRTQQTHG